MACNDDYCDIETEDTFEDREDWAEECRIIQERLPRWERLVQLAEECAELGQAALKLYRATTGENWTPMQEDEAERHFREEIADVLTCLFVFEDYLTRVTTDAGIADILHSKLKRWAERLTAGKEK